MSDLSNSFLAAALMMGAEPELALEKKKITKTVDEADAADVAFSHLLEELVLRLACMHASQSVARIVSDRRPPTVRATPLSLPLLIAPYLHIPPLALPPPSAPSLPLEQFLHTLQYVFSNTFGIFWLCNFEGKGGRVRVSREEEEKRGKGMGRRRSASC